MIDDVAIVGAGPAGARAACCLAARGARVGCSSVAPARKPCGGGVAGRALALVAGALDTSRLPSSVIARADSTPGAARRPIVPRGAEQADEAGRLIVVSSTDFDRAIVDAAERAGASLVPARVTNVALDPDAVRIETTRGAYRARFVIGADGANSLVRRRLSRPFSRAQLSIATGYFAHGVTSDEIVIELTANPPGYIWSFPRPTHLAIGVCAQADTRVTAAMLREQTAAWMTTTGVASGAREPHAADSLRWTSRASNGWSLPDLDGRSSATPAGLVDPITRKDLLRPALRPVGGPRADRRTARRVRRAGARRNRAGARPRRAASRPGSFGRRSSRC